MKKKIEKWLLNKRFTDYSDRRILTEVENFCESHCTDPEYERLIRVPMVAYLNYRLQVAKLQRDVRKRKRAVWWVFVQSILLSNVTQISFMEFDLLQTKLMETVMPMLHDEYMQKLNKKKR